MGFYNYIGGPNPLADWVPRGSIFASEFGPGGPNLGGSKSAGTPECFIRDPNTKKWLEKRGAAKLFGNLMKHAFEFFVWLFKPLILGEIQSKTSQNVMLIKIRFHSPPSR